MELTELLSKVSIVDYISQYIDLEQKGDEWWGLSCFKDEKTPSFSVRADPPVFFDYSSGIGGNLYTFIRFHDRCNRREAIEKIKAYAGYNGKVMAPAEKLSATMTCKKFSPPIVREKQSKATILADNYMERYENNPSKLKIWEEEGISPDVMERYQVRYDSFSDRIVYPIRNPDGRIVNVGGRTLDPEWKEKGQRKYCYFFPWGTIQTIYGYAENLETIKKKHEIILFEGCKSVLKAASWGIDNCGAILTSHVSPFQMQLLAKLGCDVVFALDKDVRIFDDHNIEKLRRYVNVSFLFDQRNLLDEKDSPVDQGKEVFRTLYENRLSYK